MKVPSPTVIHVEHLPPATCRRLAAIAAHDAAIVPTAEARRSRAAPAVVALLGIAVAVALIPPLARYGPGAAALSATMAVVAAAAALIVRAVARLSLAARLPLPPGRYVMGAYVVDATRDLLTVVPIARTRPELSRRWGRLAVTFVSELGRCRVPLPAAHVERVLAWMHGDVVAYSSALAQDDRVTAGQLDPLAEARDRDGTVIGVPGPVGARRRPLAPLITTIAAAAAVIVATPATWWLLH